VRVVARDFWFESSGVLTRMDQCQKISMARSEPPQSIELGCLGFRPLWIETIPSHFFWTFEAVG